MALVFGAALVTALATGLGALPFAFFRMRGAAWLGRANALAAGVMLGAAASLLVQGGDDSVARTAIGALAGVAFVYATRRFLGAHDTPGIARLSGAAARKALLIVAVMTAHSASEGIGIGASFGGGDALGVVIAIAIAVHNIPEGLAISLVMVPRGASVWSAAGWSVFSSLPQPLLAVPAYVFVEHFEKLIPVGLGFAAGAMIWMLAAELVPDARRQIAPPQLAAILGVSFAAMFAFQALLLS